MASADFVCDSFLVVAPGVATSSFRLFARCQLESDHAFPREKVGLSMQGLREGTEGPIRCASTGELERNLVRHLVKHLANNCVKHVAKQIVNRAMGNIW